MNVKKSVLAGLLGLACCGGAAQAQPLALSGAMGQAVAARAGGPFLPVPYAGQIPSLWERVTGWKPAPRGMVICKDTHSQHLCRVGLANGDFEDPNNTESIYGWHLVAGDFSPAPYLGKTPDSRVLAMPGKGSLALTAALLPKGSTSPADPAHSYTVKLRARGSGALPAEFVTHLAVSTSGAEDSTRALGSVTRSVGWDWVDVEFKVDGIVHGEPAMVFTGIERTDNNTSTMLQIDDVRIERTPLGAGETDAENAL